jgi:hypothetical protein
MALSESVILFVVSLFIGAFGVYIGGLVIADSDDFGEALLVALVGALAWSIIGSLIGAVPIVGRLLAPIVALLAYIAIVKWRYSVSWLRAGGIAILAWVIALGVLTVISNLGLADLDAVGVPRWGVISGRGPPA